MGSSFTIGRFAGVDLKIHVTFPLLLLWYGFQYYQFGGFPAAAKIVILVLAVFFCVVLHEFGHVLMAQRFGIGTRDVVLLPIGGVARLEYFPTKPRQELLIALAGPAVTLAIILVLYVVVKLLDGIDVPLTSFQVGQGFLFNLLVVNVYILLFNLIPAFPMDGGRVLRAALASKMGLVRGTRIAATVGKALAVLGGVYAVYPALSGRPISWILLLIAAFVFMAASGETAAVEGRARFDAGHRPDGP
ncbi:MAG: site-2 protease family protein [Gemmatimonadales bacterium]